MAPSKVLVVLSGGLDSTVLLTRAVRMFGPDNVAAVTFRYGSKHEDKEVEAAVAVAGYFSVPHIIISLDFIHKYFTSALLASDARSIPEGHYEAENMRQTVVPARNSIMLTIASGIAASYGIDTVWIGVHGGDHAIYPDCRPAFIEAMGAVYHFAGNQPLNLDAPFLYHRKHDITLLGAGLGAPMHLSWSCYKGGEKHCGKCGTCVERKEAFALAKIPDPTIYEA